MRFSCHIMISLLLLAGCKQGGDAANNVADLKTLASSKMNSSQFTTWFNSADNPQQHSQVIGDLTYKVVHVPKEILALQEQADDTTLKDLASLEDHYSDMEYFKLEISAPAKDGELLKQNLSSSQEYERRVSYCSFGAQKDLSVVLDGKDTVSCDMAQFERSFDVAPLVNFSLAFDKDKLKNANQLTIIFNDNLFQNGLVKFSFTRQELDSTPQLQN